MSHKPQKSDLSDIIDLQIETVAPSDVIERCKRFLKALKSHNVSIESFSTTDGFFVIADPTGCESPIFDIQVELSRESDRPTLAKKVDLSKIDDAEYVAHLAGSVPPEDY